MSAGEKLGDDFRGMNALVEGLERSVVWTELEKGGFKKDFYFVSRYLRARVF